MKLCFDGLCAAYKRKAVLEDITFSLEAGSITALTGCNGAGKTTLLRCLTGSKRDYRGRILLDGKEVRDYSARELSRWVAFLPQELPSPRVTLEELVGFGRAPHGSMLRTLTPADKEAVTRAIRAVDLEGHEDTFVDTLSGGQRKKAFFAMILAQDAPLVILDEPTAHLDAESRFAFLERMESLRKQTGKTFLVVTHDLPEILQYAHRVLTLEDRRIVFDGTPEECLAREIPQRCFRIRITGDTARGYAVKPYTNKAGSVQ